MKYLIKQAEIRPLLLKLSVMKKEKLIQVEILIDSINERLSQVLLINGGQKGY
jgi:hypothetical protein